MEPTIRPGPVDPVSGFSTTTVYLTPKQWISCPSCHFFVHRAFLLCRECGAVIDQVAGDKQAQCELAARRMVEAGERRILQNGVSKHQLVVHYESVSRPGHWESTDKLNRFRQQLKRSLIQNMRDPITRVKTRSIVHTPLPNRMSLDEEYAASQEREFKGFIDASGHTKIGLKYSHKFKNVEEMIAWKQSLIEYRVSTPSADYNLRHRRFLQRMVKYCMELPGITEQELYMTVQIAGQVADSRWNQDSTQSFLWEPDSDLFEKVKQQVAAAGVHADDDGTSSGSTACQQSPRHPVERIFETSKLNITCNISCSPPRPTVPLAHIGANAGRGNGGRSKADRSKATSSTRYNEEQAQRHRRAQNRNDRDRQDTYDWRW